MKNFVQKGDVVTITATAAGTSGSGLLFGKLFGVLTANVAIGAEAELALVGVFTLPKVEAQAWTFGAALYWDAATGLVTTVASTHVKIGHALAAALDPSTTGVVRLSGAPV
jgi:predicted RecA/RadA family phage recombinase